MEQTRLEEVREQPEEDISRLERLKEWAIENLVGLSTLSICIVGIFTTVVIGARKAIVKDAQVTRRFDKAVANLAKRPGPSLAPLLNTIAQAKSWGAKGLAWLASNLWLLQLSGIAYCIGPCVFLGRKLSLHSSKFWRYDTPGDIIDIALL